MIPDECHASDPVEHGPCGGEATGSLVQKDQEQVLRSEQCLLRAAPAELVARWGVEVEAPRVVVVPPVPVTKKVIAR